MATEDSEVSSSTTTTTATTTPPVRRYHYHHYQHRESHQPPCDGTSRQDNQPHGIADCSSIEGRKKSSSNPTNSNASLVLTQSPHQASPSRCRRRHAAGSRRRHSSKDRRRVDSSTDALNTSVGSLDDDIARQSQKTRHSHSAPLTERSDAVAMSPLQAYFYYNTDITRKGEVDGGRKGDRLNHTQPHHHHHHHPHHPHRSAMGRTAGLRGSFERKQMSGKSEQVRKRPSTRHSSGSLDVTTQSLKPSAATTTSAEPVTLTRMLKRTLNTPLEAAEELKRVTRNVKLGAPRRKPQPVTLRIYDITLGKAAKWSKLLLGDTVEGVWHTGLLVYGFEYFYGDGILKMRPTAVEDTVPMTLKYELFLGTTHVSKRDFEEFLVSIAHIFTPNTYDIFDWNCNHFSDACARLLLRDIGIPRFVLAQEKLIQRMRNGNFILALTKLLSGGSSSSSVAPNSAAGTSGTGAAG